MLKKEIEGDYRQFMDKNFIGEWDLPEKEDLKVVVDHAEINEVKSERETKDKLCLHFKGGLKPLIVNATNGAAVREALGSANVKDWNNKGLLLYRDKVSAFGKTTMAVRVRPFPPKEEEFRCNECNQILVDVGDYSARAIAQSSRSKFGKVLCMSCAKKEKERLEAEAMEGDVLSENNDNKN